MRTSNPFHAELIVKFAILDLGNGSMVTLKVIYVHVADSCLSMASRELK